MQNIRDVRKNANLFVDGKGFAGNFDEFNAPKLTSTTEDFRGGGMHAATEIVTGHEKLETDFSLLAYDADVLASFGVVQGRDVQFIAREALESGDGTITAVVHVMRGKVKSLDPGTSKPGEPARLKVAMSLDYYKLTHGARVVQEIDVPNMVCKQDGVDTLAGFRSALGI